LDWICSSMQFLSQVKRNTQHIFTVVDASFYCSILNGCSLTRKKEKACAAQIAQYLSYCRKRVKISEPRTRRFPQTTSPYLKLDSYILYTLEPVSTVSV